MTARTPGWRLALVAVLVVGIVGFAGPFTSGATFTDSQEATGNVTAADSFNGGSGPTADAGGPYSVAEGGTTTLDGTGSQTDNNPSYSWQITGGPGNLTDATTLTPTYEAPADVSQDTTVTVELTVTDNHGSDSDTATITVQNGTSSGDTVPPNISGFSATRSGNQVTVSFESNESLSDISVRLEQSSKHGQTLTKADFSTSDTSAPYHYSATVQVAKNGKYTATLQLATDSAGNDGANNQQDST